MHALLDGNWRIARAPENRGREGKWYDAIPQGAPTGDRLSFKITETRCGRHRPPRKQKGMIHGHE